MIYVFLNRIICKIYWINVVIYFFLQTTAAYKNADGKKIDNRRVLVDVERSRTVKGWLSRRLGK